MSKFKVGDRVKVTYCSDSKGIVPIGSVATIIRIESESEDWHDITVEKNGKTEEFRSNEIELIKGEQTMGRRTFRVVKETPTLNKGALVQEMCDDGDQDYITLADGRFDRKQEFNRDVVESQPKWFEEVFPLVPEYGNKAELEAFKKFAKKRK